MGSDLKVGDIMQKNVITTTQDQSIVNVSKLMKDHNIGSIVITIDRKAEGIITERDIVYKVVAEEKQNLSAKDVMSSPIMVIKPEATLEEAAKALKMHGIKRLPVINASKELVGIISEGDIMRVFPAVLDLVEERAALGQE